MSHFVLDVFGFWVVYIYTHAPRRSKNDLLNPTGVVFDPMPPKVLPFCFDL